MSSKFEDLPNELYLKIFRYLDTHDCYRAFSGLNDRLNMIIRSTKDLSLVLNGNHIELIQMFASRIVRLEVNTWHEIDLRKFVNLKSLKLSRTTRQQVAYIRPNILPKLVRLSVSLAFDFWSSTQLAQDVFSNGFPRLRYADLGRVDISYTNSWSLSSYLRSVCVCSSDPIIVPLILSACPHLIRLQVEGFGDNHRIDLPRLRLNHSLRKFIFADSYGVLSLNDIQLLLAYVPNIEYIHFTLFEMSFKGLAHLFIKQLHELKIFECFINESVDEDNHIDELRMMHPYFERIQYAVKRFGVQYFTNKDK